MSRVGSARSELWLTAGAGAACLAQEKGFPCRLGGARTLLAPRLLTLTLLRSKAGMRSRKVLVCSMSPSAAQWARASPILLRPERSSKKAQKRCVPLDSKSAAAKRRGAWSGPWRRRALLDGLVGTRGPWRRLPASRGRSPAGRGRLRPRNTRCRTTDRRRPVVGKPASVKIGVNNVPTSRDDSPHRAKVVEARPGGRLGQRCPSPRPDSSARSVARRGRPWRVAPGHRLACLLEGGSGSRGPMGLAGGQAVHINRLTPEGGHPRARSHSREKWARRIGRGAPCRPFERNGQGSGEGVA